MRSFHLHHADSDITILAGSTAVSSGSLCPPFESCPNQNLFQQYFGIEFIQDGHTHVRAISTYKFAHCFGLVESIQYHLSHTRLCLAARQHGSLNKSILILCVLAMPTAKYFCPTNLRRMRLQSKHWSAAQSALVYLLRNAGFKPMPTTASCALFVN